jgi:rRNA-processing protein FCF1
MALSSKIGTTTVILDTNILIYSASEPFDIAHQLKRLGFVNVKVSKGVMDELERISETRTGKGQRFAKLALEIARKFEVLRDHTEKAPVDDQLVQMAKRRGYIVATSDSQLRRHLRKEGVSVIYLKNKRLMSESDLITKMDI